MESCQVCFAGRSPADAPLALLLAIEGPKPKKNLIKAFVQDPRIVGLQWKEGEILSLRRIRDLTFEGAEVLTAVGGVFDAFRADESAICLAVQEGDALRLYRKG